MKKNKPEHHKSTQPLVSWEERLHTDWFLQFTHYARHARGALFQV